MKAFLIVILVVFANTIFSQNIIRQKYDEFFPNNKKRQIERLSYQKDSIQKIKDSVSVRLNSANELIAKQTVELKNLIQEITNLQSNSKSTVGQLQLDLIKLKDSINYLNYFNVVCKEELMPRNTGEEPLLINTCFWRKYKIIETGTSDYRGRYTWKTEIFKPVNDSIKAIEMVELFKPEMLNELELKINERLKEDFAYLFEANRNCFPRHFVYPGFKLKDMRFMISDNSEISFEVIYGLNSSCFAVNAASASFKIKDLVPFLAE